MRHQTLQQAARAAFSQEDWLLLRNDGVTLDRFCELASIEDVEEFVFEAYDRLRRLRERHVQGSATEDRRGSIIAAVTSTKHLDYPTQSPLRQTRSATR
jgi:hypothetical protein